GRRSLCSLCEVAGLDGGRILTNELFTSAGPGPALWNELVPGCLPTLGEVVAGRVKPSNAKTSPSPTASRLPVRRSSGPRRRRAHMASLQQSVITSLQKLDSCIKLTAAG
ncbi:MAG: hypothetical protein ACR2MC_01820, partial [Actinomycetota bacterium]